MHQALIHTPGPVRLLAVRGLGSPIAYNARTRVTWELLTWPKTTCLPSSQLVLAVQMKNLHTAYSIWLCLETSFCASLCISSARLNMSTAGIQRKTYCEPFVLGPALAMDRIPGPVCFTAHCTLLESVPYHNDAKDSVGTMQTWPSWALTLEVLVWEGSAINRLATGSIPSCEVSTCLHICTLCSPCITAVLV